MRRSDIGREHCFLKKKKSQTDEKYPLTNLKGSGNREGNHTKVKLLKMKTKKNILTRE